MPNNKIIEQFREKIGDVILANTGHGSSWKPVDEILSTEIDGRYRLAAYDTKTRKVVAVLGEK